MEKTEIIKLNADKISKVSGFSVEEVAIVKANIAKNVNDSELAYFLNVCKTVGLNPFIKEIWCYKDNRGNLLVFAGRDGFLTKAQRSSTYNGLRSSEVREKDSFTADIPKGILNHTFDFKERGPIVGAYAIVFRKDGEPTVETVEFKRYDKGFGAWKTHPEAMIKKVAEANALKKAFGISGIQSEYEYTIKDNMAIPEKIETQLFTEKHKEEMNTITNNDELELYYEANPGLINNRDFLNHFKNLQNELSGIDQTPKE